MSSYISRLLKAPSASKRLISNLTQREGKLNSLLRRLGLQRQGGAAAAPGTRPISTTQVQKSGKWRVDPSKMQNVVHMPN